jgi:hypothetical protein
MGKKICIILISLVAISRIMIGYEISSQSEPYFLGWRLNNPELSSWYSFIVNGL